MKQEGQPKSYFVVSLDFELFWGMFDKVTLAQYGERIKGERTAIPRMLNLFSKYSIHTTWATVGMLMARDKKDLLTLLPSESLQPRYQDMRISAYEYLKQVPIEMDSTPDIYHFGEDLVWKILKTPFQEIGNHTFSHFYCIDGHTNDASVFEADLTAFENIIKRYETSAESIVFPRNQSSTEALRICKTRGIRAYRGTESHFLYKPRKDGEQSFFIRGLRLIDHYINVSGYHSYPLPTIVDGVPLNIPASRFLRPWSSLLRFLEPLRIERIKRAMTYAAKHGEVFHLWWHPHNFGIHQEQNFRNLQNILEHYKKLNHEYGMESASMSDITKYVYERAPLSP